jgi:hypothetical protein
VFDPRGSRTSSKRSPPGPSSTAATTASSSTGFRLHVEYSKNPPGRTSAAAFRATATCVACRALPSPGCHRFKTSGSLRSVPSPEHGTSASTASYPRVTESETTLSPSLFRSLNTGTGTSCPMAQVTTRLAVSFAARLCLATASRSVSTRRGFPSFATTRPCSGPPGGETRSRSCMVLFPGAAHTSSTRSPAFRRGESASTGSIDTASCLAQTPAPTPSATASCHLRVQLPVVPRLFGVRDGVHRAPSFPRRHPRDGSDEALLVQGREEARRELARVGPRDVHSERDGQGRGERGARLRELAGGGEPLRTVVPREQTRAVSELAEQKELALLELRRAKRVPRGGGRLLLTPSAVAFSGGGDRCFPVPPLGTRPIHARATLLRSRPLHPGRTRRHRDAPRVSKWGSEWTADPPIACLLNVSAFPTRKISYESVRVCLTVIDDEIALY